MPTWLNSQKKARLAELAEICNIGTPVELAEWRKDQLVPALEHELSTNPDRFSRVPAFDEYYQRRNSPIKRGGNTRLNLVARLVNGDSSSVPPLTSRASEYKDESATSESSLSSPPENKIPSSSFTHIEQTVRSSMPLSSPTLTSAAIRRPLATYQHIPSPISAPISAPAPPPAPTHVPAAVSSAISRTPSRFQEVNRAPLPPSPAVVTDMIEAGTARLNADVNELLHTSSVAEAVEKARLELSTLPAIHLLLVGIECASLYWRINITYLLDVPTPLGTFAVRYPDLFFYLSGYWITLFTTWVAMSIGIPLAVAYFFNLSYKLKTHNGVEVWRPSYLVDPVIFSVVKGLLAWMVFSQDFRFFGLLSDTTVARFGLAMPAGFPGLVMTSAAGIILGLWDGIQGKRVSV